MLDEDKEKMLVQNRVLVVEKPNLSCLDIKSPFACVSGYIYDFYQV